MRRRKTEEGAVTVGLRNREEKGEAEEAERGREGEGKET